MFILQNYVNFCTFLLVVKYTFLKKDDHILLRWKIRQWKFHMQVARSLRFLRPRPEAGPRPRPAQCPLHPPLLPFTPFVPPFAPLHPLCSTSPPLLPFAPSPFAPTEVVGTIKPSIEYASLPFTPFAPLHPLRSPLAHIPCPQRGGGDPKT